MPRSFRSLEPLAGRAVALAMVLPLVAAPGVSAVADGAPVPQAYALPGTESWEIANDSREPYRIFVSRPEGPPPAEGYPVLYVLDGNAMFAGFAEARRIQEGSHPDVANSLIVAVGYPTDRPYDGARRLYDFTPVPLAEVPAAQVPLAKYRAGGQDAFRDFLLNRLRAEVAKRYAVNPRRQALFGHSLGGLLALHVLYTRPDAFHAIIAASPSQWWNDQSILAEEREFARRLSRAEITGPVSRVLLLAGEREERVANTWDAEALALRLEPLSAYGLRSRFEMLAGETHVTVPSRAVTTTLRFAFSWP